MAIDLDRASYFSFSSGFCIVLKFLLVAGMKRWWSRGEPPQGAAGRFFSAHARTASCSPMPDARGIERHASAGGWCVCCCVWQGLIEGGDATAGDWCICWCYCCMWQIFVGVLLLLLLYREKRCDATVGTAIAVPLQVAADKPTLHSECNCQSETAVGPYSNVLQDESETNVVASMLTYKGTNRS